MLGARSHSSKASAAGEAVLPAQHGLAASPAPLAAGQPFALQGGLAASGNLATMDLAGAGGDGTGWSGGGAGSGRGGDGSGGAYGHGNSDDRGSSRGRVVAALLAAAAAALCLTPWHKQLADLLHFQDRLPGGLAAAALRFAQEDQGPIGSRSAAVRFRSASPWSRTWAEWLLPSQEGTVVTVRLLHKQQPRLFGLWSHGHLPGKPYQQYRGYRDWWYGEEWLGWLAEAAPGAQQHQQHQHQQASKAQRTTQQPRSGAASPGKADAGHGPRLPTRPAEEAAAGRSPMGRPRGGAVGGHAESPSVSPIKVKRISVQPEIDDLGRVCEGLAAAERCAERWEKEGGYGAHGQGHAVCAVALNRTRRVA